MRYKYYKLIFVVAIILFVTTIILCSETEIELFNKAVELYNQNNYSLAAETFLKLNELLNSKGLVSATVLYNIGNCYFRQNKLGLARYYYELAKKIDWYNSDINYNLSFIKRVTNNTNDDYLIETLTGFLSTNTIFIIVFIFNTLFFLSTICSNFIKSGVVVWCKRVSFVLFIVTGIVAVLRYHYHTQIKAIVVETTQLTSAPEESVYIKSTVVPEAKKVVILSEKNEYYAVYLIQDKVQGWIKKEKVKIVHS